MNCSHLTQLYAVVSSAAVFLQAPLTNSDTAVLSGSLSTHNGNGGGNINMTIRRVTSAKGWGEVNIHNTKIFYVQRQMGSCSICFVLHMHASTFVCVLSLQVEFGAGDILGPLIGLKMFRNITPRRSGRGRMHAVLGYDRRSPFVVPFFRCFCHLFSQFLDSSGWFAVLSSRFAAKLLSDDSTPPGPEHHGLSAMALGPQQCHDDQSGPRHKEQSLYARFAGPYKRQIHKYIHRDWTHNIYLYVLNHFPSIPTWPSWGCLTPTWWWATITSSRMMTRQKWKALLSRYSSYPV